MNILDEIKYYKLLSRKWPTKKDVMSEIINLQAILSLPKGTEHFMSDLHGEADTFIHILKKIIFIHQLYIKTQELFSFSIQAPTFSALPKSLLNNMA